MTYKNEFPDFDYTIPNLGKGWEDNSWHNDVCPSMDYPLGGEKILRIWFDYADPEMRECGGGRYALAIGEYCELESLMGSDDLGEILDYIEKNNLKKISAESHFPIDLSNSEEAVFLCMWNGNEIVELHTIESLKKQYGETNLFDVEDFRSLFDIDMSFEEYLNYMSSGSYYHFDNLRVERIV